MFVDYQRPDELEMIDLSGYETKAGAAKALYEHLCKEARKLGLDPNYEVAIYSPEQSKKRGYTSGWQVCWECGPYQWAIQYSMHPFGKHKNFDWFTETYWGFDMCFSD